MNASTDFVIYIYLILKYLKSLWPPLLLSTTEDVYLNILGFEYTLLVWSKHFVECWLLVQLKCTIFWKIKRALTLVWVDVTRGTMAPLGWKGEMGKIELKKGHKTQDREDKTFVW